MLRFRRNKSELIVLTGALYSFVAYLTAFTLEILFLIDLSQRDVETLPRPSLAQATSAMAAATATTATATATATTAGRQPASAQILPSAQRLTFAHHLSAKAPAEDADSVASSFERFTYEAMQAQATISCLAISILYFVIFVTSLVLVVALIVRSTFMLLIWMCAMTTMYLPEFGLVTYVSVYSWGLSTRNGQTELAFYLIRAALNLFFIFRAHKLLKQWNYEKSFFRLKPASGAGGRLTANGPYGNPYDSPYFITGCDSLTTTINPMFSSSTLNLNRYDHVRAAGAEPAHGLQRQRQRPPHHQNHYQVSSSSGASRNTSPATHQSVFSASEAADANEPKPDYEGAGRQLSPMAGGRGRLAAGSVYSRDLANGRNAPAAGGSLEKFYLDEMTANTPTAGGLTPSARRSRQRPTSATSGKQQVQRHESMLSINDDLDADYEMDLDYCTLSHRHSNARPRTPAGPHQRAEVPTARYYNHHQFYNQHNQEQQLEQQQQQYNQQAACVMPENLTYSTQSLDRRHSRDFGLTEQVVLRPLGHQPFEYLQRPGSTSNLNSLGVNPHGAGNTQHYERDRRGRFH